VSDPALAPTQTLGPFAIGAVLEDRYEIVAPLGEGGMGAVYRAHDRELDEALALKVLRPELSANADALARFRREVKLARRVTHTNVARTYDLGIHEGTRFLTMELIAGESLAAALQRRIPLAEALRISQEACLGLCAAHAVGVVHRDLKPDNVMLADGRVVLTDFGIARAVEGPDARATLGVIIGTPAYMAPEQVEGMAIDGRTDVYALGVMLFEIVTGQLPFRGDTPLALAAARLLSAPPDPRTLMSDLPDGVAALITRALSRNRMDRPDAAKVALELDALRGARAQPELRSLSLSGELPRPAQARTLVVRTFERDQAWDALAADLERALVESLTSTRELDVVSARTAPSATAELAVEGSLRVSGTRVRARASLIDTTRGTTLWAEHVEGTTDDPFALEDAFSAMAVPAIKQRTMRVRGPAEPALRKRWDELRQRLSRLADPGTLADAEALHAEVPHDPWVMAMLGAGLVWSWNLGGGTDSKLVARGEELALRAIDLEPAAVDAYVALGAIQEALRLDPRCADAHHAIGIILAETGNLVEGLRRVQLALRLAPWSVLMQNSQLNMLALLGKREEAVRVIEAASSLADGYATIPAEMRLAVWWHEPARATAVADRMEAAGKMGAAWETAIPFLRSYARGEPFQHTEAIIAQLAAPSIAPRRRLMMYEIFAEYYADLGEGERAFHFLDQAMKLPFIDIAWLDHCPALASIRGEPRFAEIRAKTAVRIAQLLH
jgi:serine/threonine protein kinase